MSHVIFEPLLDYLLKNHYGDLSDLLITTYIEFYEDGIGVDMSPIRFGGFHTIHGMLPECLLHVENCDVIAGGMLAHELSHISRGEFEDFSLSSKLDAKVREKAEKGADLDVIGRSLGRLIYETRLFLEDYSRRFEEEINPFYFKSCEILGLIKR